MPSPKAPSPKSAPTAVESDSAAIDTKLVRKLADILKDTGLTEIEVAQGELKIRVSRTVSAPALQSAGVSYAAPAPAAAAPEASAAASAAPAAAPQAKAAVDAVKSPMVGTIYMQPQPDAPPFIKVGDKVSEGQTLLIIEAMKTMNPIPSPRAGTVLELVAQDGQPVEFGEGLLVLE
jgi:acetyl-CoA carboxylase biotin carboxyl carrier protein